MSLDLFRKLIDDARRDDVDGFCHATQFSCYDEPLPYPELLEMIRYALARQMFTTLFSNATLLTPDRGEALMQAGLARLVVSWESFRRDVYETTKIGADYDVTRENLKALIAQRRYNEARQPEIVLRLVVTQKSAGDLEAYKAAARELGVDAISPKPLII